MGQERQGQAALFLAVLLVFGVGYWASENPGEVDRLKNSIGIQDFTVPSGGSGPCDAVKDEAQAHAERISTSTEDAEITGIRCTCTENVTNMTKIVVFSWTSQTVTGNEHNENDGKSVAYVNKDSDGWTVGNGLLYEANGDRIRAERRERLR